MNPFDRDFIPDDRDPQERGLLALLSQGSDLTEEEKTTLVEKYLEHGIATLKKASILFILGVGVITLFFLSLPFLRFILRFASWAYRLAGGIF